MIFKPKNVAGDVVRSAAGCAYDVFNFVSPIHGSHKGRRFSTPAVDNDDATGNCASAYGGGWWYSKCGVFLPTYTIPSWYSASNNNWYGTARIHMMIKLQ